jgi:hypothetical protein
LQGKSGRLVCLLFLFSFSLPWVSLRAQAGGDDPIGFGEIGIGVPVLQTPIACLHPVVCEGWYESVWVRVWHENTIERVDVIYSGWETQRGAEIRSSPITLPQAIRSHSLRYGGKSPRLGFAGNEGSSRIVVDVANGIVYLAGAVSETSLVTEVRYVPMTDPLVEKASALLLSNHGAWLVRAALLTRRYKNLLAEPPQSVTAPAVAAQAVTGDEIARSVGEVASP